MSCTGAHRGLVHELEAEQSWRRGIARCQADHDRRRLLRVAGHLHTGTLRSVFWFSTARSLPGGVGAVHRVTVTNRLARLEPAQVVS